MTFDEESLSEVMKVAIKAEREMVDAFRVLLTETEPKEIDRLIRLLDHLAHERCLAHKLEIMRRANTPLSVVQLFLAPNEDGALEAKDYQIVMASSGLKRKL